jgi:hypothetical protein
VKAQYIGCDEEQIRWGGNDDPRDLLVKDRWYEVKTVEPHRWHTKIVLCDHPDLKFNSVCFHFEEPVP